MNPRSIINFFKSKVGKMIGFFVLLALGVLATNFLPKNEGKKKRVNERELSEIEIQKDFKKFRDNFQTTKIIKSKIQPIKKKEEKKTIQEKIEEKAIELAKKNDSDQENLAKKVDDTGKKVDRKIANLEKNNQENANQIKTMSDDLKKEMGLLKKELAAERRINQQFAKALMNKEPEKKKVEPPISNPVLFTNFKAPSKEKKLSSRYAPYGRLIKCQLRTTLESSNMNTPIIGIVLEDVIHDGKVLIKAGTEVHGGARSVTTRDRIETNNNWILSWRSTDAMNGFEMPLNAIGLDYTKDVRTGKYQISDGSAGLRGIVIKSDEYAELKLYAATFLQGAGEGGFDYLVASSQSQDTNINNAPQDAGDGAEEDKENANQIKAAGLNAANKSFELYAQRMLQEIALNGVYVRVPAGTTFYLYVQQTIDMADAAPGASSGKQGQLLPTATIKGSGNSDEEAQRAFEREQLKLATKLTRQLDQVQQDLNKKEEGQE